MKHLIMLLVVGLSMFCENPVSSNLDTIPISDFTVSHDLLPFYNWSRNEEAEITVINTGNFEVDSVYIYVVLLEQVKSEVRYTINETWKLVAIPYNGTWGKMEHGTAWFKYPDLGEILYSGDPDYRYSWGIIIEIR
jgi:hypothetical protein